MIRLKPILPRNAFDVQAYRRARTQALDTTARWVKTQQEKTVKGWKDRPTFEIVENGENERIIGTDDEKYQWADEGTKPHDIGPIVPKTKQAITIVGPGQPKTRPRVIGSGSGSRGPVVAIRKSTKRFRHPGTEAREFSEVIGEQAETELARNLQRAIDGVVS